MTVKNLYKNGTAVGPNVEGDLHGVRLIADPDFVLIHEDHEDQFTVIDINTDDLGNWEEVPAPEPPDEEIEDTEAFNILIGE